MFDHLVSLFGSNNTSRKLDLRNKLQEVGMYDSKSVKSYIMKVFKLRYQFAAIDDLVDGKELVTITPNGVPSSWEPFIQGLCAWKKPPKFDKLWALCVQEETRLQSRNKSQKPQHEEDQALATYARREK